MSYKNNYQPVIKETKDNKEESPQIDQIREVNSEIKTDSIMNRIKQVKESNKLNIE